MAHRDDFPEDKTKLEKILEDTGIKLGDPILVNTYSTQYCGFYIANGVSKTSIFFDKPSGQYKLGGGGIYMILSTYPVEAHEDQEKHIKEQTKKWLSANGFDRQIIKVPGKLSQKEIFIKDIVSLTKLEKTQ